MGADPKKTAAVVVGARSLREVIKQAREQKIIDANGIDQDSSHVIVQGERIHCLSDVQAEAMLERLHRRSKSRPEQASGGPPEA